MHRQPDATISPALLPLATWAATILDASVPTAKLIGITPAAVTAQGALESGWGKAAIGHNLFGIKADKGWNGARRLVTTREVLDGESVIIQDWFRDYDSFADSIDDHFQFLRRNSRYAACFDPDDSKTDHQYFQALKDAGYATAPDYVASLDAVLSTVLYFQRHMTIIADGAAPPARQRPLLIVGLATGPDVRDLRAKLSVPGSDTYDVVAQAAVKKFQAEHGLKVDGIVGPMTWGALGL
jgi:hypothetical protein